MFNEPLSAPEPLSDLHRAEQFSCGEPSLDAWLIQRAHRNEASGASRTYVVCDSGKCVKGYYSLSACSITHALSTSSLRRNMPDPIPMLLLGRRAVDQGSQGLGIGSSLLKDAVIRAERMATDVGVRGLLVHAISDEAKRFYAGWDFTESPADPMMLMARLSDLAATIRAVR